MSANALIHPHAIPKTMAIRQQPPAQYIQQQQQQQQQQRAIQKRLGGIKRHIMP
jgi:hypothetical protein